MHTHICKNFILYVYKLAQPGWLGGSGGSVGPVHQKALGSIPYQCTYLGCKFDPELGHRGRQPTDISLTSMFLSLSLFLSLSPSPLLFSLTLKSINISSGEDLKRKLD